MSLLLKEYESISEWAGVMERRTYPDPVSEVYGEVYEWALNLEQLTSKDPRDEEKKEEDLEELRDEIQSAERHLGTDISDVGMYTWLSSEDCASLPGHDSLEETWKLGLRCFEVLTQKSNPTAREVEVALQAIEQMQRALTGKAT